MQIEPRRETGRHTGFHHARAAVPQPTAMLPITGAMTSHNIQKTDVRASPTESWQSGDIMRRTMTPDVQHPASNRSDQLACCIEIPFLDQRENRFPVGLNRIFRTRREQFPFRKRNESARPSKRLRGGKTTNVQTGNPPPNNAKRNAQDSNDGMLEWLGARNRRRIGQNRRHQQRKPECRRRSGGSNRVVHSPPRERRGAIRQMVMKDCMKTPGRRHQRLECMKAIPKATSPQAENGSEMRRPETEIFCLPEIAIRSAGWASSNENVLRLVSRPIVV